MINGMFVRLIFCWNILHVLSQGTRTRTVLPAIDSQPDTPSITQILVFASSEETTIPFDPKQGWLLSEEKKLRLFISGSRLHNSSIVFTTSSTECTPNDYVSPVYPLSAETITELAVKLRSVSQAHSTVHLCLIPSVGAKLPSTQTENSTRLDGPYFTFVREKSRLPFAAKICLILMLFFVSGFFSGLNLGLMSLSVNDLHLIAESEDSSMRHYAKRVLPLRKRGNYLLCSIVIANVLVNSLGTILLDSLVHGLLAVIGSTVMIVLMGEIIPQAICSRYGLMIGSYTYVITWTCMLITGVISYPLGFILDKILGQEVTSSYTRDQIAGMLTRIAADIEKPEMDVITGVLSLRKKPVKDAMTLLPDVYMLDVDRKTDAELLLDVHKHGFSRIPVYANEKSNVIGIVKLRDFALITPEQYHLTVKNLLEFHSHSYGYARTIDSLYDTMQEFLKARWHIALVQEPILEKSDAETGNATVGLITLEDVIEEMLQREIIEETDLYTDNRQKIRRKQAKTMDYTSLVKRPVRGPSISPQLKIAVFQFLNTNVQQFTSGFISKEVLTALLNYNVYATVKRPANQSVNSIYLYKKGFRYELFTLIVQGNATLESGTENLMSTVGPFSFFAPSSLLAEKKSVKDVHQLLDRLLTRNSKASDPSELLDEICSQFTSDYNLIINSELQILQIHRLVWLAAVRATQRQRGNDAHQKRLPAEQLLSNAFDEISLMTNTTIDKNNLTNFQRIFRNEKDIDNYATQVTMNASPTLGEATSTAVFRAIHAVDSPNPINREAQQGERGGEGQSNKNYSASTAAVIYNPLILSQPSDASQKQGASNNDVRKKSNESNSLNGGTPGSTIHINQIFGDTNEHTLDDDHGDEKEHLIGQGRPRDELRRQQRRLSPPHARSDTNIPMHSPSSPNENELPSGETDQPRRARSLLSTANNCSPS